MEQEYRENIAETISDLVTKTYGEKQVTTEEALNVLTDPLLVAKSQGRDIQNLTQIAREAKAYLKPHRRKGTAELQDLQSLIDWANRFKGETSALFATKSRTAPKLICVADYHAPGSIDPLSTTGDATARHCHHRGVYDFPLSNEWKAWSGVDGKALEKDDMGEFIEANAKDILDPTPAILGMSEDGAQDWEKNLIRTAKQINARFGQLHQLLQMSRHFQVFESSDLTASSNRDTGEQTLEFKSEHRDAKGEKLVVPNMIIIAIPVFEGGALYRMAVRFRYRKQGGALKFSFSLYNPDRALDDSIKEAVETAHEATELPIFYGKPES